MKNKKIVLLIILIFALFLLTIFSNISCVQATEVIDQMRDADTPGGLSAGERNWKSN